MPKPKQAPEKKRDHIIKLALTGEEYQRQYEQAIATKTPLAVYCRVKVLGTVPKLVPEFNRTVWTEMGRPLGNLHQILRHLNQASNNCSPALLARVEAELLALQTIRNSIVGWHTEDSEP